MVEEDKRQIVYKLEERSFKVQNITKNYLDMMNQLIIDTQEENRKDLEITNLRS